MPRLAAPPLLVACASLVLAASAQAAPKVDAAEAAALVEHAAQRWDRRAVASEGVAVRGEVRIHLPGKKPLSGSWSFEQVAPGLFREELELPGFHEILVANGDGWWLSREPEHYLQLVADIQDALDPGRHLHIGEQRSIQAARLKKKDGRTLLWPRIVEKPDTAPAPFDLYLDPQSGAPAFFECRMSLTSYRYAGELELGESRMPRKVEVLHSGTPVATIELSLAEPRASEAVLTPPEGAQPAIPEWGWPCDELRQPVAVIAPPIRYPRGAAFDRAAGQVRGRMILDAEGNMTARHVYWATDPMFADSALEALDGRKYRPGRCNGELKSFLVQVTFSFGGRLR
jgi:hypothetical protein